MVDLVLHITPEQRQHIEEAAKQRGYAAPDDYLLALVEADTQPEELTQEQLEANFKQGLHEVLTGQTYPIEKLWDMVDDD